MLRSEEMLARPRCPREFAEQVSIRALDPTEYGIWDSLVDASPGGTIYHSTRWLAPVCRAVGGQPSVYGVFSGDQLVGGIPLEVRKKGPITIARRAFATPYAGPVFARVIPQECSVLSAELFRFLEKSFSHVTITDSPFEAISAQSTSWHVEERATYRIKLRSIGGVWRSFASEVRNRISKAEKLGIHVTKEFALGDFFCLFRDLFAAQGSQVPLTKETFAALVTNLEAGGVTEKYMALSKDGSPCAACLIVHDSQRAYYSLAASHAKLRDTGAPSLLVWQVLQDYAPWASEFDFGGANIPSITQFKSKFRGILAPYKEFSHFRTFPEKVAIQSYQYLRTWKR